MNVINYNSKCTYHNRAHGNSQDYDGEEELHVCRPALCSAAENTMLLVPDCHIYTRI
jgi:hypothetical protein